MFSWSPKQVKSYCQHTAYIYIACGLLLSKINPAEASALFTGLILLIAVIRANHLMLVLFHYFAITDLALCLSGLAGDMQQGKFIFSDSDTSIRWLLAIVTVITRLFGIMLAFRLYKLVKASKYGYLDPEELKTGSVFDYQQPGTPGITVNESSISATRAEFRPFGGRGITISA